MSTYAEMARERKKARVFYLELRALGLSVRAEENPEEPAGYRIEVEGLRSLSAAHADRVLRRVEELGPGLVRILAMGRWDPDLCAIREEGGAM